MREFLILTRGLRRVASFIPLLAFMLTPCPCMSQGGIYRIPVVFHDLVNSYGYHGIKSYSHVTSNIALLTDAYRDRLTDSQHQKPAYHTDVQIEFYLATSDEFGQALDQPGLYVDYSNHDSIQGTNPDQLHELRALQSMTVKFPPNHYLNIFVCFLKQPSAGNTDPPNLDAPLINSNSFPGRVTAHEVGHWFSLQHGDPYHPDPENIMYWGSSLDINAFDQTQVAQMRNYIDASRHDLPAIKEPFANRNLNGDGGLGGTLTVDGSAVNSEALADVPPKHAFPVRTDVQTLQGLKHLQWNGERTMFTMGRQANYGTSIPPDIEKAQFANTFPVTVNLLVEGVPVNGSVDIQDPWFVVSGTQPGNHWDNYQNGFANNAFLLQGNPQLWQQPFYSVGATEYQSLSVGGLVRDCHFHKWACANATPQDSMAMTTGVIFNTSSASILASYKAHLAIGSPSLTDARNQRRVVAGASGCWILVYESMGDIWATYGTPNSNTWTPEVRLNTKLGAASHPTISNRVGNKAIVGWLENSGSRIELHLQTLLLDCGSIWFGWDPNSSRQNSSNHRTLYDVMYSKATPNPIKPDARPVLALRGSGTNDTIIYAYESGYSQLGILAGHLTTTLDLGNALPFHETPPGYQIQVSSRYGDICPVIIVYPDVYGYPSRECYYYLGGSYASGLRVVQYDYRTRQNTVLTGGYSDYTFVSLQGATNSSGGSFALVAEGRTSTGTPFVNYLIKETYLGNGLPHLSTSYSGMQKPTVMVETNSVFGAATCEIDMTNGSTWYKASSGGGPTPIGSGIDGIFARGEVEIGNRATVLCRNDFSPSRLAYYSGTGPLPKADAGSVAIDQELVRAWGDSSSIKETMLLDFSGADIVVLDSAQTDPNAVAVRVLSSKTDGTFVRQMDSLALPLGVEIVRDEQSIASFVPSSWKQLSSGSLPGYQSGDAIRFIRETKQAPLVSYTIISLRQEGGLTKAGPGAAAKGDLLTLRAEDFLTYPNPFNPSTQLSFALGSPSYVKLSVYDVLGRLVTTLAEGQFEAGTHSISWNARTGGTILASGVYLARLQVNDAIGNRIYSRTNKLLLAK